MSATDKTTNYSLPIFAPTDDTSWADYNKSMEIIDTTMKQNATAGTTNQGAIELLQKSVEQLTESGESSAADISQIQTDIANMNAAIGLINQTDVQQNKDIKALQTTISGMPDAEDLTQLQNSLNTTNQNVNSLTTQVQSNTEDIEELKGQNAEVPFYYLDLSGITQNLSNATLGPFSATALYNRNIKNGYSGATTRETIQIIGYFELNINAENTFPLVKGNLNLPLKWRGSNLSDVSEQWYLKNFIIQPNYAYPIDSSSNGNPITVCYTGRFNEPKQTYGAQLTLNIPLYVGFTGTTPEPNYTISFSFNAFLSNNS